MGKRGKGDRGGCFSLSIPKPIFSLSERGFPEDGRQNCLPAPPNALRHRVCLWLSCQWSLVRVVCADLCSHRSETGLHCGWLRVNKLSAACECLYQSRYLQSVKCKQFKMDGRTYIQMIDSCRDVVREYTRKEVVCTLFSRSRVISESSCSYWLLYNGRCTFTSPQLVKNNNY